MSTPLFGAALSRWITRFLLLPFGSAFIGLEALGYVLSAMPALEGPIHLVNPESVPGSGFAIDRHAFTQPDLTGSIETLGDEGEVWLKAETARFLRRAACHADAQ
ncbi:MAG: hypothetical protein KDI50_08285 [Candidatus Competibacteraceae bacterium]|nr:hypothetical protein [Candidatus Competibacteraceae bacterium]